MEFKTSVLSKQDILKNLKLMDAINTAKGRITTPEEQNKSGMGTFINGIYVDLGNAVYIEKGSYHSYTFPVLRENDLTENLLVSLQNDGGYRSILISYALNESDIGALENNQSIDLSTKVEFTLLDGSYLNKKSRYKSTEGCFNIEPKEEICDAGGRHTYEEIQASARCEDPSPPAPVFYEISYSADNCDADNTGWDGETGETETGDDENDLGNPGTFNPPPGGVPITTDPDPEPEPEPDPEPRPEGDLTDPILITDEMRLERFILSLPEEQKFWLNDGNLSWFNKEVLPFLVDNTFSLEAKDFAEEAIKTKIELPNYNLDIARSFDSPYKIDLSNVKPSSTNPEPEKVKFMHIYDKLLETTFFKNVITDVFGDATTKMNVKFKIVEDLVVEEHDPNGATKYSIITGEDALVDNSVTIKIDKEYLENQPLIRIAKTMVHEVVHTHLALVNINSPYATKVGEYSPEEFAVLLDAHFEVDEDEHEFIAEHYIPTMSKAMEEILPLLEAPERLDYIDSINLYGGSINIGEWNWNDFFIYLSWTGLAKTSLFFQKTAQNCVQECLDQFKYNWYNRYSLVPEEGETSRNQFTINLK